MDREAGGAAEIPVAPYFIDPINPIDPDNPHWGPLSGIGAWLFSYIAPVILLALWLILERVFQSSALSSSEGLQAWIVSPRGLLVSVLITLAGHILTIAVCWALVTRLGRQPFLSTLGWDWGGLTPSGRFYLVSGVVVGIFVLQFILRFVLPESETTPFETMLKSSAVVRLSIAAMAVLSAPIVEEVIYRGVLYSGLRGKIGTVASTIGVTLLFSLVHYQQYQGAWASLTGLLALSFVLTLIRAVTRSILPCFVIHLIYNLIGATLILLSTWE